MNSAFLLLVWAASTKITWEEKIELVSAPGDSVWFPGVNVDQRSPIRVFQWKKASSRNDTKEQLMKPILQFHKSSEEPALIQNYSGRIIFSAFNGSFAIHNITHEDEGLYQLFTNLRRVAVWTVWMRVVDKLSAVSLRSNSSSLGDPIQLNCTISGYPHWYQWRKDGGGIGPRHQLVNGNSVLIIPGASSADCGMYTCIAMNPVSSVQINYTLTVYGIPPEQIMVIMLGTAGLVFFGVNVLGSAAFLVFEHISVQAEFQGKLYLFLLWMTSWHTPSLVAIQLALISWCIVKGIVTITIIVLFSASLLLLSMPALAKINSGLERCVSVAVPMSGFLVICLSNYILKEKFHQLNKGCHSRTLTWGTFLKSTVAIAVIHSVYLLMCYCQNKAQAGDNKQLIGEMRDLKAESSHEAESKNAQIV
ncbi:uncharacterized protein [Mobula birostris]|uniref:uncharacterized protein isoform X1 n=2 Tax=Mobula birostris TaxID=1983395 RepID=UPI003B289EE2